MNPETRPITPSPRTRTTITGTLRRSVQRTTSRAAAVLVAAGLVLALSPAVAAADQSSEKFVCKTYEVVDEANVLGLACSVAQLDTWTDCIGAGDERYCTVTAKFHLDVHKPSSCGQAWSEATGERPLEACSTVTEDGSDETPVVVAGTYLVPPEGGTVEYPSTVCVNTDATPLSTQTEPTCRTWNHIVLLPAEQGSSLDVTQLLKSALVTAEWAEDTANETISNPPVSIEV